MAKEETKRYSLDFGKKERVLNYACQTYQLSRPNKVGAVMALIRECQPQTIQEWEQWYFENAKTDGKNSFKITHESLTELGERLYDKITEVVIPEWEEAFKQLTRQDCIDYIYNLTINRTYDGYLREKSVINDGLAKLFPELTFEETDPELDHAGDIDYIAKIGDKAIGIQIKPITAKANFGSYSLTERMKASFTDFTEKFGGKVFIVFSLDKEIANKEVVDEIRKEIERLNYIKE
ncbi:MAG: MjaI family restriction endonuclease [Bacteroidales bacterium]|nr:MjaI family restriction endonuclease [Bacteroidales bacterium]